MSNKKLPNYPFFTFVHPDTRIKFSKATVPAAIFSVILFSFSAYQYFAGHWKYGVDFAGGLDLQIRFNEGVQADQVRKALEEAQIVDASIQSVNAEGVRTGEVSAVSGAPAATEPAAAEKAEVPAEAAAADKPAGKPAETAGEKKAEVAAATTDAKADGEKPADTAAQPAGEIVHLKGPEFIVKVKMQGDDIAAQAHTVREALTKGFGATGFEVLRQEGAGPAAVKDLSQKAVQSIVYALFFMFLYILMRFTQVDFSSAVGFASGAVVATVHDVVNVIAIYVLCGYEFSLPVLAAILTVVGYSVNDTIVVYDRIREKLARHRTADLWELFNECASETLTRTTITAGTAAISAGTLWIWGGGVIHDFAFVMFFGIVLGTYSSIFIASPVFIVVTKYLQGRQAAKDNKKKGHKPARHAKA